jgi:hypothetical protein
VRIRVARFFLVQHTKMGKNILNCHEIYPCKDRGCKILFLKATTLYSGGIRSHDPLLPSPRSAGDDTTKPHRQGWLPYLSWYNIPKWEKYPNWP